VSRTSALCAAAAALASLAVAARSVQGVLIWPGRAIATPSPIRDGGVPLRNEVSPLRVIAVAAPAPAATIAIRRESAASAALHSRNPVDLSRGPSSDPDVVVSFDAGSSDRGAREILSALRARGIQTTVFLTGEFIRRYPDVARQAAEDGHEIGNHTFHHPHLTSYDDDGRQSTLPGVTEEFLRRELASTASLFQTATGRSMAPLWRAPYGEENAEIRRWAESAGFQHVSWTHGPGRNLDSLDWVADPRSRRYLSSSDVVRRLLTDVCPGGILLLHLGSDRPDDPVADHVGELLDRLSARGFRFVRAGDFLDGMGIAE
jgi:peptidoglycan/xylan/chitin deacetylase (PgdA/CDA1 family)